MEPHKDDRSFDGLRLFADRLDLRLGVEKRKLILAGNEKLTFATDVRGWEEWMMGVEIRLKDAVGADNAHDLFVKARSLADQMSDQH